ncbi:tRNA (adenosine(37)-N6)-threonylcarbamoyltransferase complex ATPase subunit type 1 TsaE [Neogemmobacter tilapiae]|uniref:tRNA threonylcarbamoyladenosine biosynthesis protein TsaE n=1 Tax=Neogemmobacter tilapiae TaxID=875041 RepID=A0A918TJ86_9RHOB|nr:tRNA (adenosine(37)-N6)-threonylcarbamoyltransferase complex ATPase subunit type 1 TsaE [Gemmobacter tilapiae]GHC51568.1 tRNA (adenosine(37)-N6)-threonylcarbamoyltransferase complex ATPase subunit type 1 TsaE [Gemmobacter tilapiae]
MDRSELCFDLVDAAATERLGSALADWLRIGDTLLLEGPIGAGKTHLARSLIQARLGRAEDVPSPTFTLVQTYEDERGDIWHADLYRLSQVDEVIELGLDAAFDRAICLVEWPDRLGDLAPDGAFQLTLSAKGDGRVARLSGPTARLKELGRVC